MSEQPLVSIIIATFNAGKYLQECLESIFSQRNGSWELLVIDGGSRDETLDILDKNRGEISYLSSEKDEGIYDALNKGAQHARGRWVYFLGADDRLLPGFSDMMNQLREENTVYYGNSQTYYTGKKPDYVVYTGRYNKYRLAKYPINHQSILYPAAVFKKYRYDLRYRIFADYALNLQVWGDAQFGRRFFPVDMVLYHMSGFSVNHDDSLFKADKPALVRKSLGRWIYLRYLYKKYKKKLLGQEGFF
ncbi:MAG: glycosyltransferase [Mucilaginibacter polytrichastri]|nr:glycosyltransferase [Mucilaginibacter polytrichastri]